MRRTLLIGMAALCLVGVAAKAATIDGFAMVVNGVPNSPANEITYLNNAIGFWSSQSAGPATVDGELYYRLASSVTGPLSTVPVGVDYFKISIPSSTSITLDGTADYLVVHWGGQGGGADTMYYVDGLAGDFDLSIANVPSDIRLGGISSITLFGPGVTSGSGSSVPDGGTTVALLGLGLCGLFIISRWRMKGQIA